MAAGRRGRGAEEPRRASAEDKRKVFDGKARRVCPRLAAKPPT